MTAVNKIDSNFTGLRFAVEASAGVLPATPVWLVAEPNSYDKFGAAIKTKARNPINDGRQRKKGVTVDLDAEAGFEMDLTQDNTPILMASFMFAQPRTNIELASPNVTASGATFNPAAGGASYFAGNLLFAKNFTQTLNNGLAKVSGTPTASLVGVTKTLVDENGSSGIISRVGNEFAASVATIDVSGPLPKLVVSGIVTAAGTLTSTGNFVDGNTVTVGGKTYTLQAVLTNVDGNVKIGATAALSLVNLKNAINLNGLGVPGTDYAAAMTVNANVTVVSFTASTIVVNAKIWGTSGNAIATTVTGALNTWGGATLSGGTGRSLLELGLSPGWWVCIGDDGAGFFFANAVNNGLKRLRYQDNTSFTFDKSTENMVTDAGTAKTIRIFFGRIIKNEVGSNIVRQTLQFERTLGAPDDASPTQIQSEYITGCVANDFELHVKTADKITAKLSFLARDQETRTGITGVKAGTRPVLQDSDAYNSSSHVVRLNLAKVDQTTANPADLFAFLLDLNLSIKNNVKANKAVKFLGSFDNSAGTFEVDAKMTAYFSTVDAIASVRANTDVTLDLTFGQNNKGFTIDLPLVSLATDGADVKQDEAIKLPIQSAAATGSKIDTNLNHTLLLQYWDYLPTLAA
jgi:hypothetical protein